MPVVHVEDRRPDNTKGSSLFPEGLDKASLRGLLMASIVFLLFFLILSILIISFGASKEKRHIEATIEQNMQIQVMNVSQSLNEKISLINGVIGLQKDPQEMIKMLTTGQNVVGVALVKNGNLLAGTQNAGPLAKVNTNGFPQSGVRISSLRGKDGLVNPLIIQRAGNAFLIVAMRQGALTGSSNGTFALVEPDGVIIDGPPQLAKVGAATYFNISKDQLKSLVLSRTNSVTSHKTNGEKTWLTNHKIDGGSFSLLSNQPRTSGNNLSITGLLLTILFLGTCTIIWSLMRNVMNQVERNEDTHTESEVSQQRYRAAIEGSRGGIWEINLGNNQAYVSQSLASMLGMGETELTLPVPQFLGLFHGSDRERLLYLVRRAHMSGEFETDLNVARLPLTLSCRGRPSTRGFDNARVIIGMAMDVTEQRGSKARLEAAEARLFDALRAMNDSFVIWNQRDQLTLWNARFEDFFGFAPGTLSKGLDHATVDYNARQAIQERYESGDDHGYEIQLRDGRWIRYLETPTADGGRVSIGTDVTAIRTREHQLQANESALQKTIDVLRKSQTRIVELAENYEEEKIRAEQANQSKSEFLANMSHELRTPLNAINGFSDIMQKEMFGPLGDPRYKEYVSDILFSGQHLLSLINDILDMSKIEAGKMNLSTEAMIMDEMVTQVLRIVRGRAEENRLKLVYDEIETPEIEADPRMVKQILLNLVTNAIKFTPEGGVVSVNVTVKSAGLIVSVSDTGIGISQEDIERLAKPFEQVDSQHAKKHEGTGLGLALSKSMVELHGGNFTMQSVVGEGTTVTFTLPNKPHVKAEEAEDSEVGDEFTRLAQDIADVLSGGETANTNLPVTETAELIDENHQPQTAPPVPAAPLQALPELPPMPAHPAGPTQGPTTVPPNPYAA
jgi:two-component system cell cycle sensor histidine kinase PleC